VNVQFSFCSDTTSNPIVGAMEQLNPPTFTQSCDCASSGEVSVKSAVRLATTLKIFDIKYPCCLLRGAEHRFYLNQGTIGATAQSVLATTASQAERGGSR
jgi:hypothetical protein